MNYPQAQASNLSKPQVYSIAEAFSKQVGYTPGVSLVDIIKRLGGKVVVEDTLLTDPARSGSLVVEAPDDFTIILPAHTASTRDKFTLAHELGHYVLHYLWAGQNGRMMALRRGSDRIEWEANWFAAAFLMPTADFQTMHAKHNGNIHAVADEFGVSTSAAEIRARLLGL